MKRRQPLIEGEWYHIYNRGVNKMKIFSDSFDQEHLLILLYIANNTEDFELRRISSERLTLADVVSIGRGDQLVTIGAFCFMPNHFHILLKQNIPGGISLFMKKLATAYVMYYNIKHKRVGPLFQGRFKSQHIENEKHLRYLFSYIHLNPIKIKEPLWTDASKKELKGHVESMLHCRYTSIGAYLGTGSYFKDIVSIRSVPWKFTTPEVCKRELLAWFDK